MPLIPPLFHENCFITTFKEKAELFNSFFADQCSLLSNASKLPSNFTLYTDDDDDDDDDDELFLWYG